MERRIWAPKAASSGRSRIPARAAWSSVLRDLARAAAAELTLARPANRGAGTAGREVGELARTSFFPSGRGRMGNRTGILHYEWQVGKFYEVSPPQPLKASPDRL
uniref:Uncharacterized protein n=1 Tax=Setaria viridis TaxID=4556 RepID=A0A4U6U8S2_SETVI|nr:hypothetical protein SEVIR_5G012900v2 [Setaria viridis]